MAEKSFDVIVVGAGMVGVSSALWLQREGLNVALVDRKEPGTGASFGNAGIFADYSCHALNDPALPLQIPKMLFGAARPLALRFPYVMGMLPWFMQFLMNCRPQQAYDIAHAVEYMCRYAKDAFTPLLEDAKAFGLVDKRGVVQVYEDAKSFAGPLLETKMLNEKQYRTRVINPQELSDIEPNFRLPFYKAILYEDAWNFLNPGQLVSQLVYNFTKTGGAIVNFDVQQITSQAEGGINVINESRHIHAKQVVLAAGAFSTKIKGSGADRLPLEAERGYHIMFDDAANLVSRPIGWMNSGVFVSPINGGTRASGTVEFGGLTENKSQSRLAHIENCAKAMLPDLEKQTLSRNWLGHRPTMPDSLPVIGRTKEMPEVILAFGHQHIGMTLGGITGKLVSEIAINKPLTMDISAYRPDRFNT